VDDLKVSHVDIAMVDHFISMMDDEFGKETPLSNESRGKTQDYLGMVLDFSNPGQVVVVSMIDCVRMILQGAPSGLDIGAASRCEHTPLCVRSSA